MAKKYLYAKFPEQKQDLIVYFENFEHSEGPLNQKPSNLLSMRVDLIIQNFEQDFIAGHGR